MLPPHCPALLSNVVVQLAQADPLSAAARAHDTLAPAQHAIPTISLLTRPEDAAQCAVVVLCNLDPPLTVSQPLPLAPLLPLPAGITHQECRKLAWASLAETSRTWKVVLLVELVLLTNPTTNTFLLTALSSMTATTILAQTRHTKGPPLMAVLTLCTFRWTATKTKNAGPFTPALTKSAPKRRTIDFGLIMLAEPSLALPSLLLQSADVTKLD